MNICPRFGMQCNTCNNGCHFQGEIMNAELEQRVEKAVLELMDESRASGYMHPIPNTDPQRYIVTGTKEDIESLLKNG